MFHMKHIAHLISDIESLTARESECWADVAPTMSRDKGGPG